jgi:hypothetical protein
MADTQREPQNRPPVVRGSKGRVAKGSPSLNPGGRPKKLVEIERMLDEEHRTVANVKEVFAQLKAMATEAVITRHTDKEGNTTESIRQPNPAFMALYLDRILGPVKELKIDLTDAPDEVVAYQAEKLN